MMKIDKQKIRQEAKRLAKIIVAILIVAGIAWLIWWLLSLNPNDKPQHLNPPPVKAFRGEENFIKYWFRDGSYLPQDKTESINIDGKEYSLAIKLNQEYISPIYGSKVSGSIEILENGHSINALPPALVQRFADDAGNLKLYVTEFGIVTPRWKSPLIHQYDNNVDYQTPSSGIFDIPMYSYFEPNFPAISSFIYSKNIEYKLNDNQLIVDQYIPLSQPQAEFELHYLGGRISPYIEITAGFGDNQNKLDVYEAKHLYFADQKTNDWQNLDIAEVKKGEFYYDVELEGTYFTVDPIENARGITSNIEKQFQVIKMTVTSQNSNTDEINTDPIQRVNIMPFPARDIFPNYLSATTLDPVGIIYKTNERWRLESGETEFYEDGFWQDKTVSILGPGTGIELDLVDGQAEIYFSLTGSTPFWQNLAFVVRPANFYQYESCKISYQSWVSYCTRDLPEPPEELKDYNQTDLFLYGQWHTNDVEIKRIYTIATISQDEMPHKSFDYDITFRDGGATN